MSEFLNELNEITATKEEYAVNEESKELQRWVHSLSYEIKSDIKKKASSGQYVIEGSNKKVTGYVIDLERYMTTYIHASDAKDKMQTNETLYARAGLGIFKGANVQTFWRKVTVSNWFLKVLSLTTESLKKEGLHNIKLFNAFEYDGQYVIGNSMIFSGNERISTYDSKNRKREGSARAMQYAYYEFLF